VSATKTQRYLVIFDCDGVLVDSEPTSNRVLASAITQAGLSMEPDEVALTFEGMRLRDIQASIERRLGRKLPEGWLADFEARRAAAFEKGLAAIPGVADVLSQVSAAGIPTCVASQASRRKMELTLGLTGLKDYFPTSALFSSTMVERGKPYPDLFLLAAESMGFEPSQCIVVEDGVPGVQAGCQAGMKVLGYAPGDNADRLADAGAQVFASMTALAELLGIGSGGR
jgi:HAD superfamily hydrolase (TIGR01509 family)